MGDWDLETFVTYGKVIVTQFLLLLMLCNFEGRNKINANIQEKKRKTHIKTICC